MQAAINKTEKLSYCADMVRAHDRELYILALTVPETQREGLLAIYALATELSHIRHMVSEEMIGHIRYAWWRETLQNAYAGTPRPGHPVLEALTPLLPILPEKNMLALVDAYADTYPEKPSGEAAALETLSLLWLSTHAPASIPAWQKAHGIIARHGNKRRNWLLIKLIIASYF